MQAGLILQESTHAYRHRSIELLLVGKLCAGLLCGTIGICTSLPSCADLLAGPALLSQRLH